MFPSGVAGGDPVLCSLDMTDEMKYEVFWREIGSDRFKSIDDKWEIQVLCPVIIYLIKITWRQLNLNIHYNISSLVYWLPLIFISSDKSLNPSTDPTRNGLCKLQFQPSECCGGPSINISVWKYFFPVSGAPLVGDLPMTGGRRLSCRSFPAPGSPEPVLGRWPGLPHTDTQSRVVLIRMTG